MGYIGGFSSSYFRWRVNMLFFGLMTLAFFCLKLSFPKFQLEHPELFEDSPQKSVSYEAKSLDESHDNTKNDFKVNV